MSERMKIVLRHYDSVNFPTLPNATSRGSYVPKTADSETRMHAELAELDRPKFLTVIGLTLLILLGVSR